jgi:hypothetical protein
VIDNAWKDENEEMKHWKFQLPFDNIGLKTEITATMSKFPIRGRVERIQTEGKYVTAVSLQLKPSLNCANGFSQLMKLYWKKETTLWPMKFE